MSGVSVSVSFSDEDVKTCAPNLKGVETAVALEKLEHVFCSYLREAGMEILSQLLRDYKFSESAEGE